MRWRDGWLEGGPMKAKKRMCLTVRMMMSSRRKWKESDSQNRRSPFFLFQVQRLRTDSTDSGLGMRRNQQHTEDDEGEVRTMSRARASRKSYRLREVAQPM